MQKAAFSLYNASAGSGKTYTLVKEYLKIILLSKKPDAYRNILAITFTNKAVHEMKSRIVDTLFELSKENTNPKTQQIAQSISEETGLSLPNIHAKAQEIIKSLIHNYAAFDISTIDKFTHKVIRSFAHDLNLPITFEVSIETDSLLAEAVDSLLSKAGEDQELTKLLVDYTMEKTDDDKSWDISNEIIKVGQLLKNENNSEEIKQINTVTIADFVAIKSKLQILCQEAENQTVALATTALQLIEKNGIDLKSFSSGHFPAHLANIQQKKFNPASKTYHEFGDIKINKTAVDKANIESIIPELLEILKSIYDKFSSINFYKAILKNITPLSLLNSIDGELKTIQNEQNILSIAEFNKLINEQIKNQPAPFIYERLGEKYKHFFIDEFQDTSQMQWQNLVPLIDNALSGEDSQGNRGSLLIVGDPKQSIYRWRGGKAEQFIELEKGKIPFSNKSFQSIALQTNYRSYANIINFNNDFFKWIANNFSNPDYKELYANQSYQKTTNKTGGFVSINFLPKATKEEQTEEDFDKNLHQLHATLQTINKVTALGFLHKEIVVLVRKNEQGVVLANYLTQQNIPIISSESLLLANATDVQTIIHFLRYINNANNLEAKAEILYAIANNKPDKKLVHQFIANGMQCQTEEDFENYLLQTNIAITFKNWRKKSLFEVVEAIAQTVLQKNNAYIQFFQDLVLEQEQKKQTGLLAFLNYWDNNSHRFSIPLPEENDAVKIMTIHKSKGLEFPVVILPFSNQNYSHLPTQKMWLHANSAQIGLEKVLVDKTKAIEKFDSINSNLYLQKQEEDLLDIVNVLYVALTRAEEQLYIISEEEQLQKNGAMPNTLATYFINYLATKNFHLDQKEYQFGSSNRVSVKEEHHETAFQIPSIKTKLEPSKIKIAQRESIMWNTKQQKAIEYGNILHEILAFVKTKDDIDLAINKAIENGLITLSQKEEVLQTILEIVNHKELTDYFSEENQVMNEQTIIQKGENSVKPDRMSISNDKKVFLLDYKTGQHLPKHKTQLENYQKTIEDMGYKVEKKALVYIGEEIEIVELAP